MSFTFQPNGFVINDLHTGSTLFQGQCKDGLYPLKLSHPPLRALSASACQSSIPSTLWHCRLGHPSSQVIKNLALNKSLGSFSFREFDFCKDCALGKSTRLPFVSQEHKTTAAFELIHNDVWMSPFPLLVGIVIMSFSLMIFLDILGYFL